MLYVRELSVRAGDTGLRGAELWAAAGECVAVLGDGGAALLVRTVAGLLTPAAGSVRLDGEDLAGCSAADVAARGVAMVPAGWAAFGELTVRENVLVGARGGTAVADAVLAATGLPPEARAGTLTDADTRLLGVAVALARRPRLLLVDGVGAAAGRVAAAVRVAEVTTVAADAASFSGRAATAAEGLDVAAFDRVYVVRSGALRPWHPAPAESC